MVSIKDVAKMAGVSIATVSRCINFPDQVRKETQDKVKAAILESGYSPNSLARNFRRGKTHMVMVVLPSVGDPFFTDVMKGIQSVAEKSLYNLLIKETQFNTIAPNEFGNMIVSKDADGIILLASVSPFGDEFTGAKSKSTLPIVIGCEPVSPELEHLPSVRIDNRLAAKEATEYMISLGHKRIGFIYGSDESLLTRDRQLGYREAMKTAGLPVDEGWVIAGHMTIEGAQEATRRLIDHAEKPTAIFCANDEMAIAAMHTCKTAGLTIPKDISVMGIDDIRYAAITEPPLTTVAQPAETIGERAMIRLCQAIDKAKNMSSEPEIVEHKLMERGSVMSPPEPQLA